MKKKKKIPEKEIGTITAMAGDVLAQNTHAAVNEAISGMNLFLRKAAQVKNVDFAQSKGNLFEYIEACKFNQRAATVRNSVRAVVTDPTDPHAAADIRIVRNNQTLKEVQAKFVKTANKNGVDTSAAESVAKQAGIGDQHVGKYHEMDRLIRKQENYKEGKSLLEESKRIAKSRADSGNIYADEYRDVEKHLTDELHHENVNSGGTTYEEVEEAHRDPTQYAKKVQDKQFMADSLNTAKNMAITGAAMSGIITGIQSFVLVYQDKKTFREAVADVGTAAGKGAIRGGATGFLSVGIRRTALRHGSKLFSDSNTATILASGMIDCGIAVYSYARGEIDQKQLVQEILNTAGKGAVTVYFTKLAQKAIGLSNPCIPMAIYTAASFIVSSTKAIIESAELQTAEYNRLRDLIVEATVAQESYYANLIRAFRNCEHRVRESMSNLLKSYSFEIESGQNYDNALRSLTCFADSMGIVIQYATFEEFENAMINRETFVLE